MIEAAQLRKGTVIELDGELYRVFDAALSKIGRGGANVKTKLRNLSSGAMIDKTFGSNDRLQDVRLESRRVQYLYNDGDLYHFMDLESYEQPALPVAAVSDVSQYLVENMELNLAMHAGRVGGDRVANDRRSPGRRGAAGIQRGHRERRDEAGDARERPQGQRAVLQSRPAT